MKTSSYVKELLVDNDDIVIRGFLAGNVKCATIFVDGLVNREIIDRGCNKTSYGRDTAI